MSARDACTWTAILLGAPLLGVGPRDAHTTALTPRTCHLTGAPAQIRDDLSCAPAGLTLLLAVLVCLAHRRATLAARARVCAPAWSVARLE